MTDADKPSSQELERTILRTIMDADGEESGQLLAILADRCAPPLHRWFAFRDNRIIALALDAAVRGEVPSESLAIAGLLSAISYSDAIDTLAGKGHWRKRETQHEDSALAAIGGHAGWDEWPGVTASNHSFRSNVELLRDMAERRRAIDVCRQYAKKMMKADPRSSCASEVAAMVGSLAQFTSGGREDLTSGAALSKAIEDGQEYRARVDRGEIAKASWGIAGLDREVPLRAGGLYVLTAPPGVGKTSLALQAASKTAGTAHCGSVLLVSMEMTAADLAAIMASRTLGVGTSAIRDGTMDNLTLMDARELAAAWHASGSLLLRDGSGGAVLTAAGIGAWCRARRVAAGGRLAMVVIDYLGLIDASDARQNEYQRLSEATRSLKRLAVDLGVPVVLLSQLNRQGTTPGRDDDGKAKAQPEPRLSDLRGSGSIEQDADAVIALHRTTTEIASVMPVRALILKNRRGRVGGIELTFTGATQEFTEIAPTPAQSRPPTQPKESEDLFHDTKP